MHLNHRSAKFRRLPDALQLHSLTDELVSACRGRQYFGHSQPVGYLSLDGIQSVQLGGGVAEQWER